MANIAPLSVQFTDRIKLDKRERSATRVQEVRDAQKATAKATQAAKLQAELGLGNPKHALEAHKADWAKTSILAQADKLGEKFQPVKEPSEKFFPRFVQEGGGRFISNMASGTVRGRVPLLAMVKLGAGIEKLYCRIDAPAVGQKNAYEANIPVMPLTVLELAKRAKECAPNAEFHLLFMPSWEPAPQRDPVLVAHIPGTDEWFQIAEWDGDKELIKEFLEDR